MAGARFEKYSQTGETQITGYYSDLKPGTIETGTRPVCGIHKLSHGMETIIVGVDVSDLLKNPQYRDERDLLSDAYFEEIDRRVAQKVQSLS